MTKRVVVIGGGIAGVSITRELAKAGVGVRLFERSNQLCAGATWHAAGLVTRFGGSSKLKKLHVRSLQMLTDVHSTTEGGIGLHLSGSIRLVMKGDRDRVLEAKHHQEMAKLYDDPAYPTSLVTPSEIADLHPLVDVSRLEMGLHTVNDGDVDPTLLTNALADRARRDGAKLFLDSEVTKISKTEDEFKIEFKNREPEFADAVVNATGLWSQRLSEQMGLVDTHPAFVIEHHYAVTEPIEKLKELRKKGHRVPVLRDLAGSSYIRQEQDGMLVGPYEELPTEAVHSEWGRKGPPLTWAWDLFPDKAERLYDVVEHALEMVPALEDVGFKSVVNGPTIWAPDSLPRCGRTQIPGYYDFNTLTYGIAHSMPLAEHLKTLMLDGEQPYDLAAEIDPLRYGPWATDEYASAKIVETYSYNNKPGYPANFENRKAGRGTYASEPLRELAKIFKNNGALTSFSQGVETALVYSRVEREARFDAHEWAESAVEEARNVRASVGVSAATGFSKIVVRSKDESAREFLMKATTNVVPKTPGACRLTYAVAPKLGSVVAEFTVSNLTGCGLVSEDQPSKNLFYVVGSRDYAHHDVEWLKSQARALGFDVDISNASNDFEILLLAGPDSKTALLDAVSTDEDRALVESLGFLKFSTAPISVAGKSCSVARVSFTGEAGYELHVPAGDAPDLLQSLLEKGLKPFGAHATNSLRLEKGFKVKGDLDFARFDEAGISAFTRKSWIPPAVDGPPTRRAVLFEVTTDEGFEWSVPSDCPVFDANDDLVGFTTTSAFGTEAKTTIAAGFLKGISEPQLPLTVSCFGARSPCRILEAPPAPVRGFDKKKETTPDFRAGAAASPKIPVSEQFASARQSRSMSTSTHHTSSSVTVATSFPQQVMPISPWMREEYFVGSRLPFEEAHCFGGAMYADNAIHADERSAIFRREWVIVGHLSDLSKPGDVVPFEIAGNPFFVANDKGNLKAYHNVCRHRGAKLVHSKQSGRAVVTCPYHRWGYSLDGKLVGTPCWDDNFDHSDRQIPQSLKEKFDTGHVAGFQKKDYGLFKCELETWGGMLFARAENGNDISLQDHLGDLPFQLRNYPLHETVVARQKTVENIQANWKILGENFSEYYHLPAVHPELCTVSGVNEHVRTQGKGKYLGFATSPLTNGGTFVDPIVAPPMPGLEGTPDAFAARHVLIYPNTFMSIYPHHIFRVIIEPISAGVSRERTHLIVHPKIYDDLGPEKAEETIDNFMAFHQKVNGEDMGICEAVQSGVASAPYTGGRLSFRFEETIHRYQNLVADSLVGRATHIPEADASFDALNDLSGN